MKIELRDGLPFVQVVVRFGETEMLLSDILLDTGSAGTVLSTDRLQEIGVQYEPDDMVHRIRGIGGTEFVFVKNIDSLKMEGLQVNNFAIEVGLMDYGFAMDGIIGMDFLTTVKAKIDLASLEVNGGS
jgi:predicted aspartyl protease